MLDKCCVEIRLSWQGKLQYDLRSMRKLRKILQDFFDQYRFGNRLIRAIDENLRLDNRDQSTL